MGSSTLNNPQRIGINDLNCAEDVEVISVGLVDVVGVVGYFQRRGLQVSLVIAKSYAPINDTLACSSSHGAVSLRPSRTNNPADWSTVTS